MALAIYRASVQLGTGYSAGKLGERPRDVDVRANVQSKAFSPHSKSTDNYEIGAVRTLVNSGRAQQ